ncbi:hypothetical protein BDV93DRAFT_610969 [Ceratobasidium sp. AG-I]|nr:hypothetical protein BDV93DRAFT_610969 [Ceratobasidium sp. AG-I]
MLHLNSLTIGTMGRTSLVVDSNSMRDTFYSDPDLVNPNLVPPYFRSANVQPARLHIDSYLVCLSAYMFSPRLTLLEVFLNSNHADDPDHIEWRNILSSTPNLTELSLWDFRYKGCRHVKLPRQQNSVELRGLKTLELSGRFIHITELLVSSPLPNLRYLSLDSSETAIATLPAYLSEIALVSPALSHVRIGSISHAPSDANAGSWAQAFHPLRTSLRELVFVETEWREVLVALNQLTNLPHSLSRLRLEQVWDMENYDWDALQLHENKIPTVELVDCLDGQVGRCGNNLHTRLCESQDGSNFSSNSSFSERSSFFPSSEELDSDESEISYDSFEDSLRAYDDEYWDEEDSEVEHCMWGAMNLLCNLPE